MPSIWFWNAFLMAFRAMFTFFTLSTVTRWAKATPSRVESISHTRIGIAGGVGIPAIGGGLGDLAGQGGGGHLAAGHAVNGVVDKDDGDVLAAGGGVDRFGSADGGQVAVALVGEDHVVRAGRA